METASLEPVAPLPDELIQHRANEDALCAWRPDIRDFVYQFHDHDRSSPYSYDYTVWLRRFVKAGYAGVWPPQEVTMRLKDGIPARNWLDSLGPGSYVQMWGRIWFARPVDAAMFLMIWGGEAVDPEEKY